MGEGADDVEGENGPDKFGFEDCVVAGWSEVNLADNRAWMGRGYGDSRGADSFIDT